MSVSETNNQKIFSIIIATYNCGQKIENTLQSIFSQNKDLFELIILDGASSDDTLDYIKKYESDLTLISEKDDGVYYAFNKAIDLATGKYLYFIGAGDCLKPDILEKIKEFLPLETPSLIYGKCYFVQQKTLNGKEFTADLFIQDNLCQQGMFYHRDIFDIVGNFDIKYKLFADWFFNTKCFLNNQITKRFVNIVIADYEEGGISSRIQDDPVFVREFPLFVRRQFGLHKYILCKAFLKSPLIFNYIYHSDYKLLFIHLINNYSLTRNLGALLKPYVLRYRNLRKTTVKQKVKSENAESLLDRD